MGRRVHRGDAPSLKVFPAADGKTANRCYRIGVLKKGKVERIPWGAITSLYKILL